MFCFYFERTLDYEVISIAGETEDAPKMMLMFATAAGVVGCVRPARIETFWSSSGHKISGNKIIETRKWRSAL